MPDERYVIEVAGSAAGLLVGGSQGLTFHACADWAWPLDGSSFNDPGEAQRVVTDRHRDQQAERRAA
jgi:hypothetical protein